MIGAKIAFLLLRITRNIISALAVLMIFIILYGIFSRYLLQRAVPWVEELAIFLMIWIVFLGISVAANERGHIGMLYLQEKVPTRIGKYLRILVELIMLLFLSVVMCEGIRLCMIGIPQKSPALRVSYLWPYISVPAGAMLMIVQVIFLVYIDLRDLKDKRGVVGPSYS